MTQAESVMKTLPSTPHMRDALVSAIRRSVVVQGTNGVVMSAEAAADSLIAEGWVRAPNLAEALKAVRQNAVMATEENPPMLTSIMDAVNGPTYVIYGTTMNKVVEALAALAKLEPDRAE